MKNHKISGRIAAVAVFTLAATTMVGVSTATAADLTNTTWSVSNSQTGAENVTYTYEFTTKTEGTIKSVTATVPDGTKPTGAEPGTGTVYGLGSGGASSFTAGAVDGPETLTYTVTTPKNVAADVPIYIEFTGLTNSSTAGTVTSTVTTLTDAGEIDSVTSPEVTFGAASTIVTVEVPQSLTFENDTPSFELQLDPALPALSTVSKDVVLKVRTNAGQGYALTAQNTGLKTEGPDAYAIPNATSGTTKAGQVDDTFAFTTAGTVNTPKSTINTVFSSEAPYVGYVTGTSTSLLAATGPTGDTADVLTITNQVKITFNTPAGTYKDTITYVATPTY